MGTSRTEGHVHTNQLYYMLAPWSKLGTYYSVKLVDKPGQWLGLYCLSLQNVC